MPRHLVILLGSCLVIALSGCSKPDTPESPVDTQQANPATPGPALEVCTLLTSQEIESVQGEPLKEAKPSTKAAKGLIVSQCYFALPTFVNSISLTVVEKEGSGGRDPKQLWKEIFSADKLQDKEYEGGKKKLAPKRIPDLGDEAFWTGSAAVGALHVLKGNKYITISVGGAGDQETKIKKSKDLAQIVLKRLY